jgi:hypothetical protein
LKENAQVQEQIPEVEEHILSSFPPRFRSRVQRISNFILSCERIELNKKYQLIMDGKMYENSNIIDNLSDMLYPIKTLPTIDQQLFYAILNECNMPQTYISNPYRKRLQLESLLFEKPKDKEIYRRFKSQDETQERSGGNKRRNKSSPQVKERTKSKVKKAKKVLKQTKQKSKLSKIARGWLAY